MSRLDTLPPDQRATLSLLLSQRKGYSAVASLLRIGERAVHDRAHAALAVLAPSEARGLTPEGREEIGEYLLGQSDGLAERLHARNLLDTSPAAQAWATAVVAELAPLATSPLPAIPEGSAAVNGAAGAPAAAAESGSLQTGPTAAAPPPPDGAGTPPPAAPAGRRGAPALPSSRVGGAIVLAAIVAVIVLVVVLTSGGGSHKHARSSAGASASAGTTSASSPRASETRRLTLTPPNPASKALGVAAVLQEGSTYAFYLAAEHLPPSRGFFYAVWLYNSPSSFEPLSKSPPVGADGRLQGGSLLPANAGNYHQMIVTRETNERPTSPGPIVLRGPFGLH
jgi:hypothetical protein